MTALVKRKWRLLVQLFGLSRANTNVWVER